MKKYLFFLLFCFSLLVVGQGKVGVCMSLDKAPVLKKAGGEYVEISISSFLMPEQSDSNFAPNLAAARECQLPILSGNGFFPGDITIVGPNAEFERAIRYTQKAMERASQIGLKVAVLGSSRARSIPEGFPREEAREQFVRLCRSIAEIAQQYGVVVVLEPLRKEETNFINTVWEGLSVVREVNHPNFRLLADLYHMACEDESPKSIRKAGKYLQHVHIAERANRTPPASDGDDFTPYFKALRKIHYKGNISIECGWSDFEAQVGPAVEYIHTNR